MVYDVELYSTPAPGDTLSPCNYLIEWTMPTSSGVAGGFSAYFDGHHYRYRGDRLQEYHLTWDAVPFSPKLAGSSGPGVQRAAQFADLLPDFLAEKLADMQQDSTYRYKVTPDTKVDGVNSRVVTGVRQIGGLDALEYTYVFDSESGMPRSIDLDNNPGSISEQIVTVTYTPLPAEDFTLDEQALIERYPEVFEKYRESNFSIENLPGNPLPEFSSPTLTGERYTHHRTDKFRVPTIVALLDTGVGDAAGVVRNVRAAVERLPFDAEVIWAFVSNKAEDIEEAVGPEGRIGEYVLMGARALARDSGAATLPVIILAGSDGRVADVVIGDNKDLTSVVIQKMALMPHD